jgi:hypothetical protein
MPRNRSTLEHHNWTTFCGMKINLKAEKLEVNVKPFKREIGGIFRLSN